MKRVILGYGIKIEDETLKEAGLGYLDGSYIHLTKKAAKKWIKDLIRDGFCHKDEKLTILKIVAESSEK